MAARAARRVTNQPLAAALRDREGAPFGRTAIQRGLTRLPSGGLFGRIAARASLRRPARTVAVVAQIAAAVGVAFLIPTLARSVNDYNTNAQAIWQWESRTTARDPGLPFAADVADDRPVGRDRRVGVGLDRRLGHRGLRHRPRQRHGRPGARAGRWFAPGGHEAVLSAGFADRTDIRVGDSIEVELAAGTVDYTVVGLADDYNRTLYTDRTQLAADLGAPGMTNVVWSTGDVDDRRPPRRGRAVVASRDRRGRRRGSRCHRRDLRCDRGDRRRGRGARRDVVDDRQPVRASPRAGDAAGARRPSPPAPGAARARAGAARARRARDRARRSARSGRGRSSARSSRATPSTSAWSTPPAPCRTSWRRRSSRSSASACSWCAAPPVARSP